MVIVVTVKENLEEVRENDSFVIPEEILVAARNGRLVIFLGAGVCVNYGAPSWSELVKEVLLNIEDKISSADLLCRNIDEGIMSPLEVLDKIEHEKARVYEYVNNRISSLSGCSSSVHKAIGKASKKILTSNYDTIMEDNVGGLDVCVPCSPFTLSKIRKSSSFLFKIHGSIDQIDNCALFSFQYNEIYDANGMVVSEIKSLMRENTFLYVGFSLSDPYYKYIFDSYRGIYKEYANTSYMITSGGDVPDGVKPVLINDYSCLEAFFSSISDKVGSGNEDGSSDIEKLAPHSEQIKKSTTGVDVPPQTSRWVGRSAELDAIAKEFSSIFISGMGGQGKSALAARYMEVSKDKYDECYWRDFKEEGHNFSSKIMSIIMNENSSLSESDLVGHSEDQLVDILLDICSKRRLLIVLDNVDRYIDIESFVPVGGIGRLWKKVESIGHKSRFLFTCRPFINHAGVGFYQLALRGISSEDVRSLLDGSAASMSREERDIIAKKIYAMTKGHPLWVSLIIAQAKRGKENLNAFIVDIEKRGINPLTETTLLSQDILSSVWNTLNDNQRFILRALAESVSSETFQELERIVSPKMNFNKFNKAISVLGNLNLIVFKGNNQYVELHPLVREFVISKYPGAERTSFIALFASYYGRIVVMLKPKLGINMSLKDFEKWISKINLDINAGNRKDAFNGIREIFDAMKGAGFVEDLVGVSIQYISSIDWRSGEDALFPMFDTMYRQIIGLISEYGGDDEFVDESLGLYEESIGQNSERFINSLSIRCYRNWIKGDFSKAISYGERAEYIKDRIKSDDNYLSSHNLALARRDSGVSVDLDKALSFFLSGDTLSSVLSPGETDPRRGGPFYGNVGRCLFLKGDLSGAEIALCKSFVILIDGDTGDRLINLGYAAFWLYEVLASKLGDDSRYFLLYAISVWKTVAPALANKKRLEYQDVISGVEYARLEAFEDWRVERFCADYARKMVSA